MSNGWGGKREGSGRRKGAQELASRLREACKKAIELSEAEGKPLEELLKVEMQSNPIKFVQAMSPLVPKELEITKGDPLDDLTDDELSDLIARLKSVGIAGEAGAGTASAAAGEAKLSPVH